MEDVPILCAMKKSLSELEMMRGDSVVMVGVGAKEGVDVGGHGVGRWQTEPEHGMVVGVQNP